MKSFQFLSLRFEPNLFALGLGLKKSGYGYRFTLFILAGPFHVLIGNQP